MMAKGDNFGTSWLRGALEQLLLQELNMVDPQIIQQWSFPIGKQDETGSPTLSRNTTIFLTNALAETVSPAAIAISCHFQV